MPRPKLHSDEAVLDAARAVLKKRGPSDFTLSDVAEEIGMSRAALIQRFQNKESLLRQVMARSLLLTRAHLDGIPTDKTAKGLRAFLDDLCDVMCTGQGFETQLLIFWHETRDTELKRMSHERMLLVQEAIAKRVPKDFPLSPSDAATLLHNVIGGASMQWLVAQNGRLDQYVKQRLDLLLRVLIPNDKK